MRTSELAAAANVNPQTLRYYERRGLLPEPERMRSGYRDYQAKDVRTVRFIKRAQDLGFTLADIEELLHLAAGGPESCDGVRSMATVKINDLEQRIADLSSMRDGLARLVETCEEPRAKRECPILLEIERGDPDTGDL